METSKKIKKPRGHHARIGGTLFWIPSSIRDYFEKVRNLDVSSFIEQTVEVDIVNSLAGEIEEWNIVERIYKHIVNIDKNLREALPSLILSGFLSLFAGYLMTVMLEDIKNFPGLFVLIVPIIGLRGAASSSFASRFNSAYHLGLLNKSFNSFFEGESLQNIYGYLVSASIVSVLIGYIAYLSCTLQGLPSMPLTSFIVISTISGIISSLLLCLFVILLTYLSINRGWDPSNIVIPLLTTLGDVFGVLVIYYTVLIVGGAL